MDNAVVLGLTSRVSTLEARVDAQDKDAQQQLNYTIRIEAKLDRLMIWALGSLGTSLITLGSVLIGKVLR